MPGWVQTHFFLADHGCWFWDFTKIKCCFNDSWLFVIVTGDVCAWPCLSAEFRDVKLRARLDGRSANRPYLFLWTIFFVFFRKCCCMFICTRQCPSAAKSLQSCLTLRPHRRQPTRLRRPWDSPGKNTGVGCHFLLQCMKVKRESDVAQSCPTLLDPLSCSPPGSSVHGIFQGRVLEWAAIAFSSSICLLDKKDIILLLQFASKCQLICCLRKVAW